MALIKDAAICAGVLLLLAAYSSGNPIPRDRRSDDSGCCQETNTCTETDTVAHVFKGIKTILNLTHHHSKTKAQDWVSTYKLCPDVNSILASCMTLCMCSYSLN